MWRVILSISAGLISSAVVTYSLCHDDMMNDITFKSEDINKNDNDNDNNDDDNDNDAYKENNDNKEIIVIAVGSFSVGSFLGAYISGCI